MPNSKPPGRKPPGRKPPARKPGGRKPASGGPRGGKAASEWKPGSRKTGARKPGGAKHAGGWKPGARKSGAKSASWKAPGRTRDSPPRAARPRRDEREQRSDETAPPFEEHPPRPRQMPHGRIDDGPRPKRREPPPRDEPRRDRSPRETFPRASSRSERPEGPREELPRDLIRRKPWLQMPPRRETPVREAPAPRTGLETSDIRRGLLAAIADAHATGPDARRARVASAEEVGGDVLQRVAAPLLRTVAAVLTAEGYRFIVSTPAGTVRLSSAASVDDYLELVLDTQTDPPALLIRTAHVRRDEGVIDERVVAEHPAIGVLTDAHLLAVLITALRPFVDR